MKIDRTRDNVPFVRLSNNACVRPAKNTKDKYEVTRAQFTGRPATDQPGNFNLDHLDEIKRAIELLEKPVPLTLDGDEHSDSATVTDHGSFVVIKKSYIGEIMLSKLQLRALKQHLP
jgi:hypothetical protein